MEPAVQAASAVENSDCVIGGARWARWAVWARWARWANRL